MGGLQVRWGRGGNTGQGTGTAQEGCGTEGDGVVGGGGELSGERVFRDFLRAKERECRRKDAEKEAWKGWKWAVGWEGGNENGVVGGSQDP